MLDIGLQITENNSDDAITSNQVFIILAEQALCGLAGPYCNRFAPEYSIQHSAMLHRRPVDDNLC